MTKFTKASVAILPSTFPVLLTLLILWMNGRWENFGERSDLALFSLALGIQACYASYKATNKPPAQKPKYLPAVNIGVAISVVLSVVTTQQYLSYELRLLESGINTVLVNTAWLNIVSFVVAVFAALAAEFASA